jgi:hypothetical protein
VTDLQRDALIDFLAIVMRYVMHHGAAAEQAEVLEAWQELYERFLVDSR